MATTGELIKTWRKDGFTLRLFDTGKVSETNKTQLAYEFKDGRNVVFAGGNFWASPCHAIDSLETIYELLGFLSVGEGDVDSEYFKDYTPEQIAWRDSDRREQLSLLVCDFEERRSR
jgi:hypothetical protein